MTSAKHTTKDKEPMTDQRFRSFREFWPYYLREHSKEETRALHFAGTTVAMVSITAGVLSRRLALIPAGVVMGYGMAWIGHFFIEKNRPATFKYPLWSFQGDMKMWSMIIAGTLDAELARLDEESNGVHTENGAGASATVAAAPDPQSVN